MSLKDKIMNIMIIHPKIITLGIGLAVTFAAGMVIRMVNHNQSQAFLYNNQHQSFKAVDEL